MMRRLLTFLEELRNSSESRKRRWTFGMSACSMSLIFILWLVTLQVNLSALNPAARAPEEGPNAFLGTLKTGGAILLGTISSYIGREREVMIERKEFTFTPKNTPVAPIHELPIEQR
ncbi:MAG: hypothetical protein Q8Q41_02325 [bacterium]|nr:hypothetical protein [bacterium]